ncbi:universal stress protein [Candidatus Nitrosotenuis aquarius]|uniref:universal stress protein n=1 Tax=Candidatus Nitrosotenuis aquarius TaxID=1846278 RepID=UPI0013C314A9|nr:universal stress protein [Candidatus Nitrosotenuis aquarius]
MGLFENLLVPVDGSIASLKALNSAIEISQMSGAQITILHVIPAVEESPKSRMTAFEKQLEKQGQDILDDAASIAKKQKVKFKTSLLKDSPGHAIVRLAKKGKFDHVIMSTTGTGSAQDDMLGSVSNYVVHKSEIPVYLIR